VAGVTRLRDRRRQPDGFDLGEVNLLRGMIDVEPNDIAVAIEIDEGPSTISRTSIPGELFSSM
jgi:hypothetical protein